MEAAAFVRGYFVLLLYASVVGSERDGATSAEALSTWLGTSSCLAPYAVLVDAWSIQGRRRIHFALRASRVGVWSILSGPEEAENTSRLCVAALGARRCAINFVRRVTYAIGQR